MDTHTHIQVFGVSVEEAVSKSANLNPAMPDIVTMAIDYVRRRGLREEVSQLVS